jgi:hypothetical protein
MGWNYRVVKVGPDKHGESWLQIVEGFYHEGTASDSIPHSWSQYHADDPKKNYPCWAKGDDLAELRRDLEKMLEALDKPVLVEVDGELRELER